MITDDSTPIEGRENFFRRPLGPAILPQWNRYSEQSYCQNQSKNNFIVDSYYNGKKFFAGFMNTSTPIEEAEKILRNHWPPHPPPINIRNHWPTPPAPLQ